jgi:hypothetical protein
VQWQGGAQLQVVDGDVLLVGSRSGTKSAKEKAIDKVLQELQQVPAPTADKGKAERDEDGEASEMETDSDDQNYEPPSKKARAG